MGMNASPKRFNADMRLMEVRLFCELDESSQTFMRSTVNQLQKMVNYCHRSLKLAHTSANLFVNAYFHPPT